MEENKSYSINEVDNEEIDIQLESVKNFRKKHDRSLQKIEEEFSGLVAQQKIFFLDIIITELLFKNYKLINYEANKSACPGLV